MIKQLGHDAASWVMIGHLQRNKVKVAVQLFDSIQTVDSLRLAKTIDRECEQLGRIMPILIEVNAAREPQKSTLFLKPAPTSFKKIAQLESIQVRGLMMMGALASDPEELRPVFSATKSLFDRITAPDTECVDGRTLDGNERILCRSHRRRRHNDSSRNNDLRPANLVAVTHQAGYVKHNMSPRLNNP